MSLENKNSLGIGFVMIGREVTIDPLFNYLKEVEIPSNFTTLNLNIVQSFNKEFKLLFDDKIAEYDLGSKYNINLLDGVNKANNELEWEEWEEKVRFDNPYSKHYSTATNLTKVMEFSLNNDYIHIIDDDTIPPINAIKDLYSKLKSDTNIGMTSGFYFSKTWNKLSVIKGYHECKRKIVASIAKRKWIESTLDDFVTANTYEVGYVGNGCILVSSGILKNTLPLNNEDISDKSGPDLVLSQRIRIQDKKIIMVPSVICQHLNENGEEVGIPLKDINIIRNIQNPPITTHISLYSSFINYRRIASQYDEVYIIHRKFQNIFENLKEIMYLKLLSKISNIKFVEKDVPPYINTYGLYNPTLLHSHILIEYSYECISNNPNKNITVQTTPYNIINEFNNPSFNVLNIQKYINN